MTSVYEASPHGDHGTAWLIAAEPAIDFSAAQAQAFLAFAVEKFGAPVLTVFCIDPRRPNPVAEALRDAMPTEHCRLIASHVYADARASNVRLLCTNLWGIGYRMQALYFAQAHTSLLNDPACVHWLAQHLRGELFIL